MPPNPERRRVLINLPAALKRAAAEDDKASNLNDAIVGVLAEHYDTPFDPTGRDGGPVDTDVDGKVLLRMPAKLKNKLARDAFNANSNLTDRICQILADHYGVDFVPRRARAVPFGGGARV